MIDTRDKANLTHANLGNKSKAETEAVPYVCNCLSFKISYYYMLSLVNSDFNNFIIQIYDSYQLTFLTLKAVNS